MDETELQFLERRVAFSGTADAAAVLFAGLVRLGELGEPGLKDFLTHLRVASRTMPELMRAAEAGYALASAGFARVALSAQSDSD